MYLRFKYEGQTHYGVQDGEKVKFIKGSILEEFQVTDNEVNIENVTVLPPSEPTKIVCVGLNYKDHAKEVNMELPKEPLLFMKPNTTVVGNDDDVLYPKQSKQLDYEAELGIVIGKKAKNVKEEEAKEYISGYTCANDVTARDIQFGDGQWTRGKSFDTFCPVGPGIVEEINEDDTTITLTVNGEIKQKSNLNQLIFSVNYLVSYISSVMTLLPGDIIITGTPHGVGPVNVGDEMTVSIEGIGELTNRVISSEEAL